jgi:hypothetical protein
MKWLLVAAVIVAAVGLAANGHAQETPPLLGDADCSRAVAAVDATITLQYTAAMTSSVPCPESADTTVDDAIDSRDAGLMLQMSAGLIAGIVHMPLAVEPSSACDASNTCTFDTGSEFHLTVGLDTLPREGYIAFQSYIYTTLEYRAAGDVSDELLWPDAGLSVRFPGVTPYRYGQTQHGALSSATPPFPESVFNGTLVDITVACPEQAGVHTVALRPYTEEMTSGTGVLAYPAAGTTFQERKLYTTQVVGAMDMDVNLDGVIQERERNQPVAAAFTVNCV